MSFRHRCAVGHLLQSSRAVRDEAKRVMRTIIGLMATALVLGGCGGGSSDTPPAPPKWQSGVFQPSPNFAALCAAPRSGTDPATGMPYPDKPVTPAGTVLYENNFLRSWTNELYLWFDEVVDQDPSLFSSTASYFSVLRTTATTASGAPQDKFHFTYSSADWYALSQGGEQVGYGAQWVIVSGVPPRQIVVAYVDPGSPAVGASLARGAQVLSVDGVDVVNDNTQAGVDKINAGLNPATANETHVFQVLDLGASVGRTVSMISTSVVSPPVPNVATIATPTGPVGYILFNAHVATAEAPLVNAFTSLQAAGVNDLVLDLRYNGGGYLELASEVAYMIAGASATSGMTFELQQFNSKSPTINPVTGQPIAPVPFLSSTQGFSPSALPAGKPLPALGLMRVYVLTGPDTCSASEAIINGLRGIGLPVVQIGSTTCGKPYGFYPQDNCGTTYFSIEFRGVNNLGYGDYSDGFAPANTVASSDPMARLPGCSVADDFTHALGDPAEARLAAALNYRATNGNSCPAPTGVAMLRAARPLSAVDGMLPPSPLRQMRMLRVLRPSP
jgi:carboxyl-terminal processing protease